MRLLKYALAGLLGLALTTAALAQVGQGTQTWWNASRSDVATQVSTTATSATTLTLTPQNGQYVYVTSIRYTNCAGASAVTAASVTTVTTTNLGGVTLQMGSGVAAGLCVQDGVDNFSGAGLRAAAPGPVTVVTPTYATNQTIRVAVYWYSAP